MRFLIYVYFHATVLVCISYASMHTKLSHFEILKPSYIRARVKKNAASGQAVFKSLKFFALGNQFNITLKPGSPVIDPVNLEVKVMDASRQVTLYELKGVNFYVGRLLRQPSSYVDAAYIGGVWSAHVQTSYESFFIEPLYKHDEAASQYDMIIYRQTALKLGNNTAFGSLVENTFCRIFQFNGTRNTSREDSWSRHKGTNDFQDVVSPLFEHPDKSKSLAEKLPKTEFDSAEHFSGVSRTSGPTENEVRRLRRQSKDQIYYNTCDMLAIMDAVSFKTVGQGSVHKSAAMLVYWYQLADRIFKRSKFGAFRGMRLKVKTILIMKEYTPAPHFNSDPDVGPMYADEVLKSLTNNSWFNHYCLVHLTTARHFESSVLGLATIANVPMFDPKDYRYKEPFWKSGICSANAQNAAFSCIRMEKIILTDPMYLVIFVHEIAHGWGAEHDDYPHNCAPAEHHGGKYIMWSNHNGAKSPNSFTLSPCSGASIQEVLWYKAHKCLLSYGVVNSACGNSILEYPEECDEGLSENSSCCTNNCRLRDGAICSSFNHPCCTDRCTVSPSTQQCYPDVNISCSQDTFCDGFGYDTCPQPPPLPNGSPCDDKGSCWHGVCLNYCESKGRTSNPPKALVPCTCDTDRQAMCARCCAVAGTNSCLPETEVFDDGMPCLLGFCKGGECVGRVSNRRLTLTGSSLQNTDFMGYLVFAVLIVATPPFIFYTLCVCLLGKFKRCQKDSDPANEAVEVIVVTARNVVRPILEEEPSNMLSMSSTEV